MTTQKLFLKMICNESVTCYSDFIKSSSSGLLNNVITAFITDQISFFPAITYKAATS